MPTVQISAYHPLSVNHHSPWGWSINCENKNNTNSIINRKLQWHKNWQQFLHETSIKQVLQVLLFVAFSFINIGGSCIFTGTFIFAFLEIFLSKPYSWMFELTLSQMTKFRLFQTERLCGQL